MSEEKINPAQKDSFGPLLERQGMRKGSDCLSDEELAEYVDNIISGRPRQEAQHRHAIECDYCFAKIASAVSALRSYDSGLSIDAYSNAVKKAKSIPRLSRRGKADLIRRNRYLLVAAVFFTLSFIFKVYFLQFLLAALVFGLKWVMDTGGSKALIMIYDTWRLSKNGRSERDTRSKDSRI